MTISSVKCDKICYYNIWYILIYFVEHISDIFYGKSINRRMYWIENEFNSGLLLILTFSIILIKHMWKYKMK